MIFTGRIAAHALEVASERGNNERRNRDIYPRAVVTSPTTTKGDIIANNGGGAQSDIRVAVGTNGQILAANSATASGLEWIASPAAKQMAKEFSSQMHSRKEVELAIHKHH